MNLFKQLTKDIVPGLNIQSLAKNALKSAQGAALDTAASMVASNKTIQERAGKAIEKQAVAGIAGQIADFYSKNKLLVIGGLGAGLILGTYFFLRGILRK